MVLGFVELQKQFDMSKRIVYLFIDMFFHGVKTLIDGVEPIIDGFEAVIHRFGEVAKAVFRRDLRIDQRDDRENDCDCNRDDLGIGQGFLLSVVFRHSHYTATEDLSATN